MMEAVLSNADHPEYGVVTIPFPIPREQFDHCIELVEALEIGNASAKDCNVDEIRSAWPVLNRLEGKVVNLDELDYLAKRLDSFDIGEAAQFQAMAHKLELFELRKSAEGCRRLSPNPPLQKLGFLRFAIRQDILTDPV